jgi:hypothetical protein
MSKYVMNKRPFRVNFENISEMRSEDLIESEILVKVLKVEVPKAIKKAIQERKTYATVFEINSFGVFVEIHKKDWVSALNSCIALHAKDEEYEACGELTKTIDSLSKK